MSYREKVKNQPLGTPMDLHFLTGIPHQAPAAVPNNAARFVNDIDVKASESAIALPIEQSVHPGKRRKRRR